jgi:hypothetical protein
MDAKNQGHEINTVFEVFSSKNKGSLVVRLILKIDEQHVHQVISHD